jgi:hypothetical protein
MFECKLVSKETQTAFGPLCLLGHYLGREGVLEPLSGVQVAQKSIKHSPQEKLIDALVGILSGCRALYEINVRVRPDAPLREAFGRDRCADQSTIQRTLNAFTQENVCQLREAVEAIQSRLCRVFSHDYFAAQGGMLILEVDLTGLKASESSEGSTKGYFSGERNATGRQLVRVSARNYGELVFQKLYPGNTLSLEVLKETLGEVERILGSGRAQRERTLLRLDGGFGTDENVEWLCERGYHFVIKGYGGSRAGKLARSVPEDGWQEGPTEGQRLAVPEEGAAPRYSRQTKTVLRRWSDAKGKVHTDYLLSTFAHLDAAGIAKLYDSRAGIESDIKGDKRGLGLEKRRKKSFPAQEAVVLLCQLAHNLLVWFERHFLGGTKAEGLGMERLVREVMAMPAQARVGRRGRRVRLRLPYLHPWASAVAEGVAARYPRNRWRAIWREN